MRRAGTARRRLQRSGALRALSWSLSVAALPGCGGAPTEEAAADAPAPLAAGAAPRAQESSAAPLASLFEAGSDGLLHSREVELPDFPTTRGRAEALVRRLVEEAGTFPVDAQVLDVFVSGRGVAVVNFTLDLLEGHSGGLLAEELTIYSLSHALVESFPAIAEVRVLVEGRETETLAGHLDLRSGFGRAPERLLADPGGGAL